MIPVAEEDSHKLSSYQVKEVVETTDITEELKTVNCGSLLVSDIRVNFEVQTNYWVARIHLRWKRTLKVYIQTRLSVFASNYGCRELKLLIFYTKDLPVAILNLHINLSDK